MMNRNEQLLHMNRQDRVDVMEGMDMLLVLGVAWIRIAKQKKDEMKIVDALSGLGG
jgi:hypothetical protein